MKEELWFKAKLYGWGWYPCCLKGWLVLLAFCILFLPLVHFSARYTGLIPSVYSFIAIAILVLGLLIVCFLKGEKPRWRWGK